MVQDFSHILFLVQDFPHICCFHILFLSQDFPHFYFFHVLFWVQDFVIFDFFILFFGSKFSSYLFFFRIFFLRIVCIFNFLYSLFCLGFPWYIFFFIFFFGLPALAGRVLWNRICPSFRPSVCPGFFLELYHYFFLNFSMRLETHIKLCMTEPDFPEKNISSQKFLTMLKSFVINFYWICWIMKIDIICCVPAQIPYLGKFLRYGPKCFQPIRLQDFLINHISRTLNLIIRFLWILLGC